MLNEQYLKVGDISSLLNISDRSVWRLVSAGRLPKPLRLSTRITRWRRQDVDQYLNQLAKRPVYK